MTKTKASALQLSQKSGCYRLEGLLHLYTTSTYSGNILHRYLPVYVIFMVLDVVNINVYSVLSLECLQCTSTHVLSILFLCDISYIQDVTNHTIHTFTRSYLLYDGSACICQARWPE